MAYEKVERNRVGDVEKHSGHILVVDDEESIQILLTELLYREGYEVTCASNGRHAVELIQRIAFDLIITDIAMPGRLNGIDVLRAAKSIDPEYQVIVITGFDYVETAARVLNLGAANYIPKPFNIDLIRMTVATALEMKWLRASTPHRGSGEKVTIVGASKAVRS